VVNLLLQENGGMGVLNIRQRQCGATIFLVLIVDEI